MFHAIFRLRALLIHKGTKQDIGLQASFICLRALLIHKGTKLSINPFCDISCLRALLIHKGTKLGYFHSTDNEV